MARVLVVDDADKIRAAVRKLLEKAGHDVVEAANGRECLRVLWVPILMVTARDAPPEPPPPDVLWDDTNLDRC